jgi:protein involved in polysaccharide export with SLBB domain
MADAWRTLRSSDSRHGISVRTNRAVSGYEMAGYAITMLLLLPYLAGASGCGATAASVRSPKYASANVALLTTKAQPVAQNCRSSNEMRELWRVRTAKGNIGDYPVGPGDLLRISVAGIDQLERQEVRVGGDGTITFPFAGTLHVAQMTDQMLEHELAYRLSEYIKDPEVSVFNEEDKSRTVRVMGLVNKPGLMVLASKDESIIDTIAEAGGLRDDASQRIYLSQHGAQPAPSSVPRQ